MPKRDRCMLRPAASRPPRRAVFRLASLGRAEASPNLISATRRNKPFFRFDPRVEVIFRKDRARRQVPMTIQFNSIGSVIWSDATWILMRPQESAIGMSVKMHEFVAGCPQTG